VGKLNIAGLGAVWQARRQQSRDIAVNGLHVALNTTCRFAYRNRSSATKGLQKLSSFSRQGLPKSSGVAKPMRAERWAFPDLQVRTNAFIPSSGERTSNVTVFIIPPRNILIYAQHLSEALP
jgi:hypothetical protein